MQYDVHFNSVEYKDGKLGIHVLAGDRAYSIEFEFARTFRLFDESDYFAYIDGAAWEAVNVGASLDIVCASTDAGYLLEHQRWSPEERLDTGLKSYLVTTSQECLEVISFEPPTLAAN